MNIGIVILATNVYFVMGIRLVKNFVHHYKGSAKITFYFFSDTDPKDYVSDNIDIVYMQQNSKSWVDGTNQKFSSILSLQENTNSDYLFYFDADTDVCKDFTEDWFIGDIVVTQHFGDQAWMIENKAYDRHAGYNAYIPYDTDLPQMYYQGAFFGGKIDNCINVCNTLRQYQIEDQAKGFEPDVNDESYINKYFHYNPATRVVLTSDFQFAISTKGGIENYRNTNIDISHIKDCLRQYKNDRVDIRDGQIHKLDT